MESSRKHRSEQGKHQLGPPVKGHNSTSINILCLDTIQQATNIRLLGDIELHTPDNCKLTGTSSQLNMMLYFYKAGKYSYIIKKKGDWRSGSRPRPLIPCAYYAVLI